LWRKERVSGKIVTPRRRAGKAPRKRR
jgi:hypothetical protein